VIGNPPYVRQEKIKNLKPLLQKQNYYTFSSTADLYVYFYEKGYQLLKDGGILSFITSNKWMRAKYGENLRRFLKNNTEVLKIIDFSGFKVFDQTVDTNIILFRKGKPSNQHFIKFVEIKSNVENVIEYINQNWKTIPQEKLSENTWTLADEEVLSIKEKIERIGKPLKVWDVGIYFGIKTGYNEAFIIDTETRNRILANCKDEEERKRTEEIIKPVLRGRDIGKYSYKWAGLWIIGTFPAKHINIDNYPSLREYLRGFGDKLLQDGRPGHRKKTSNKWFETQDNIAYYPEFEKEKIVWQEIVREPSFAYDNTGIYVEATAFLMTGNNLKYILGLLNSRPVAFFFKIFYAGGGLGEDGYRYKKAFLEQLPIPPITPQNQPIVNQIVQLVDQILSAKQKNPDADTSLLEQKIDELVYKLYDLTEEEIKLIEGGYNE
jgi:type II restriction/modification system DNA methylase subunit YeeA